MTLHIAREDREVIEVDAFNVGRQAEEGAPQLLTQAGHAPAFFDATADKTAQGLGRPRVVTRAERQIVNRLAIAFVTGQGLIASLAREDDLDMTRGQLRDEVERDGGRMRERLAPRPH